MNLPRPALLLLAASLATAVASAHADDRPDGGIAFALEAASPTGAVLSVAVPEGWELYRDSFRLRLEPEDAGAAPVPDLPPPDETEPEPAWTDSFSLPVSFPAPLPSGAALAVTFQTCEPGLCHPLETRLLPLAASPAPSAPSPSSTPSTSSTLSTSSTASTSSIPSLPSLSDFTVIRSRAGYLGPEEYLAFLRGEEPAPDLLSRMRARGGIALLVLALLAGGFLLNLTPCVLPLVPVNLALLGAGLGRASRGRGALLGAAFGLGTALAFGALGLLSALTGRTFGAFHGSPIFNAAVALVFCLLAFAMLDVLRLDLSTLRNRLPGRRHRSVRPAPAGGPTAARGGALPVLRAFGAGAGSALLAGACVAPVLASALVLAADLVRRGHPAGALVPFALGLGMGLPWPLLGAGVAALPRPGRWMERVKQLFAAVFLFAAACYMVQAYRLLAPREPSAPAGPIAWLTDETAAAIVARAAQGPLLLDLSADWCRECKEMDRTTFADPSVAAEAAHFPAVLRVDCTDTDAPRVRDLLRRLGAPGLPFSAILAPPPPPDP